MLRCSTLILALLLWPAAYLKGATPPAPPTDGSLQQPAPETPPPAHAVSEERNPVTEAPVPATTGVPGLFSVETAETLPKGVVTLSAYLNKFSRAPGSATVLTNGLSAAVGITNKITLFAQFDPYIHFHVGQPPQLSLRQPPGCPHTVPHAPIYCALNPGPLNNSWVGPAAGFVPDFPFAAYDNSDWGPLTLGLKTNFFSEKRGDPLSVSLGAGFIIPTRSTAAELANFGAQTGTLTLSFTLGLSKRFQNGILLANNFTYIVTRNPHLNGQTLFTPGDRAIFGQGFLFPIRRRLQLLTEYTAMVIQEGHFFGVFGIDTQNTSCGPSVPVDGVWGVRWYFHRSAALDIGYRYMLNLTQVDDRHGFVFKIGTSFRGF